MTTQAPQPMPYVFLSYASADRERALQIATQLEARGVAVWIDRKSIAGGTSWSAEIVDGIKECEALVALCSSAAVQSRNVQQEIQLAWEHERKILPLRLDRTSLPSALEYALAGRQWVDVLDLPDDVWLPAALRALGGFGVAARPPPSNAAQSAQSAVATIRARPASLPTPSTPLIGRDRERAEAVARVLNPAVRLLTMTGPAGIGKTRLALQVALDLVDSFPDGVYFIPLAPIADPTGVLRIIAEALGLPELPDRVLLDSLRDALKGQKILLVLDNFEQVVAAAVDVAALIQACLHLTILVTSRIALHISAERVRSPRWLLPDPQHLPSTARISQYEAVRLFIERARSVHPDFTVTNDTAPAVAEICWRLDGLPLAIELAAARTKILSPQTLLARLERRLAVLTGGMRDLPARQQTLRGAIAWSHDLLAPPEQILFRRLAVFVGSFSLEAADAIVAGQMPAGAPRPSAAETRPPAPLDLDVLDGIESLVSQSLLRQVELTGTTDPRFTMLETIREFGQEKLRASDEHDVVGARHAAYFLAVTNAAAGEWQRGRKVVVLQQAQRERDNLRAAWRWAEEQGDAARARDLATALGWLVHAELDLFQVGSAVADYERLLAHARDRGDRTRELDALLGLAHAHYVLALDNQIPGAPERARSYYDQAEACARALGDVATIVRVLVQPFMLTDFFPDYYPLAAARALEALALSADLADEGLVADSRMAACSYLHRSEAEPLGERLIEQLRERLDWVRLNYHLFTMSWLHLTWGNFGRAVECCDAAMAVARTLGVPPVQYPTLKALALASLGRLGEARAALAEEVADDDHPFGRAVRDLGEATVLLQARQPAEAAQVFRRLVEEARVLRRAWLVQAGEIGLAQSLLLAGRVSSAELLANGLAVDHWAEPIPAAQIFDVLAPLPAIALADIRLEEGRFEEAWRLAGEAAAEASRLGRVPDEVLAGELKVRLSLRADRPAEAVEMADVALTLAEKIAYLPLIWRLDDGKALGLEALGDLGGSERALGDAAKAVLTIAEGMPDSDERQRYLADPAIAAIFERQRPAEDK